MSLLSVLPLELMNGVTRHTLELDGSEVIDINGLEKGLAPRMDVKCRIMRATGEDIAVALRVRLDTRPEVEYYRHGGIFHSVLRRLIGEGAHA